MKIQSIEMEKGSVRRALIVIAGVSVNVILSWIISFLKLPLYLDTIGTIATAAVGGLMPGIFTAVVTNTICSIFNEFSLYYTLINVLIAVCTAWFVKKNKFEKKRNFLCFILLLAVLGGGLGMGFQWILIGGPQFADIAQAAETFSPQSGVGYFLASVLLNIGLNIVDKGIAAAVAFLILRFVPEEIKKSIRNSGWKQKPLSDIELKEFQNRKEKGKSSLYRRMTGLLLAATVSMAVIMASCGISLYSRNLREDYSEKAVQAAEFAARVVDGNLVDTYVRSGEAIQSYQGEGYQETNELLCSFFESLSGIQYLYVYQVREDGCHVVFDTDPEVQENGTLGELVPFDESFLPYVPTLLKGERMDVLENDDTYGFFLTAYEPIYDSRGRCVAYAGADASMVYLESYIRDFIWQVLLVFLGFLVLIVAYGMWITGYYLNFPVKSMAAAAQEFIKDKQDQKLLEEDVKKIRALEIRTGDEIEDLYQAICKMATGMTEQMRDIRHYADATAQMQNGLIITMADMVENRDSDTGAHIQKTAAYVRIILNGLKKKGYYLEKLTPKFMSDVEMSAPLHDVGKINIPDAVLNKPGKLTDEEYEIMKTHTTAGKKIMENAINTVQGENYLKEARNMAAYHHERWDGKGYPEGLYGEVIPLSARIMAVADVFDALSSPRVYKPAFPLEKSLSIIKEGAGTQFDPKCVEVFLDSLDEVKLVLKKYHQL